MTMMDKSGRIMEILEVLEQVWHDKPANIEQVSAARVRATKKIAHERQVDERTIRDKYARQLDFTVKQFDDKVYGWLRYNDHALRTQLEAKTASRPPDADLSAIREFFELHPTPRL